MERDPATRSFGKRTAPQAPRAASRAPGPAGAPLPDDIRWIDHADPELDTWKGARRRRLPWRQISFTASLCFGIAALVLPDTVNEVVDWLLYGLAAASLYAGFRKRADP